jgi:transcriptional regulator with XRE-family HTH domain
MVSVPSVVRTQVGERVRELRLAYRITQEELAERSGLSYKFIGEIERGQANPTIDTMWQLAKALRIDVHELFLTPGRETGPDAVYRMGLHDIEVVREALHSAENLLERLKPLRRRGPRRPQPKR